MPSSYNGWPASPDPGEIGIDSKFTAPGEDAAISFPGGVKAGDVSTMLRYVASEFFARVEAPVWGELTSGRYGYGYGCWGYNYRANANNPNNLSNHSSGTALDLNATLHPNGSRGTFNSSQVAAIREILAECSGVIEWGGDFSGTPDEMHFDINTSAAGLASAVANLPGNSNLLPPDEWWDTMTPEELQAVFTAALNDALAPLLAQQSEMRRLVGVAVGYPPAEGTPEQTFSQAAAAAVSAPQPADPGSVLDHLAEVRRMTGVGIGWPAAAGTPEYNLAPKQ